MCSGSNRQYCHLVTYSVPFDVCRACGAASVMSPHGLSDGAAAIVAFLKASAGGDGGHAHQGGTGAVGQQRGLPCASSPTALRAAMVLALHRANARAQVSTFARV